MSARNVSPIQYSTVVRKLLIMIEIATIIAKLTASAATDIAIRERAPPRLALARRRSTAKIAVIRENTLWQRKIGGSASGTSKLPEKINASPARYPHTGKPAMGSK